MIKKIFLIVLALNVLLSCDIETESPRLTKISGQIINPINNYALLTNNDNVSDTISIDDNGFFKHEFIPENENLYRFIHKEFQYVYIEPGDSIVIRLNTLEFDESIAFSGNRSNQNTFLINQFLNNDYYNTTLPERFKLNPADFEKEIVAQRNKNNKQFKLFSNKNKLSDGFIKIAQGNIDYNYYSQKELYTAYINSLEDDEPLEYPKGFYNYRKNIDFDNKALSNYYAYYSFLNRYFDNAAFDIYKNEAEYNRESYIHNETKLKLIDTTIKNNSLHNHILTSTVKQFLLNADNTEYETRLIALFNKLNLDLDDQKYIKAYALNTAKINAGNKVPNLTLVNIKNETVMLHDLRKQLSLIYFWSSKNLKHVKLIHAKVTELKSKFPEYNFIGINTDTNFKDWKNLVLNSGYSVTCEFQFENPAFAASELSINSSNKALIIDKNGIILEGNSHIFHQNFESKLLSILNK